MNDCDFRFAICDSAARFVPQVPTLTPRLSRNDPRQNKRKQRQRTAPTANPFWELKRCNSSPSEHVAPRQSSASLVSVSSFSSLPSVNDVLAFNSQIANRADAAPDAPPVVVLGYRFWQRQFGGDPKVIGRELRLNDKVRIVIGIMPRRFMWRGADVFTLRFGVFHRGITHPAGYGAAGVRVAGVASGQDPPDGGVAV